MRDLGATVKDWLPGWVMREQMAAQQDPCEARLARAAINAPHILPPATRDPRQPAPTPQNLPTAEPANIPVSPPLGQAYARRPQQPKTALTSLPLARFSWGEGIAGSRSGISRGYAARVCPDHMLIDVAGGSARLVFPGLEHLLPAGSVAFIPAGTAFSLLHGESVVGEVLSIPNAFLRQTGVVLPRNVLTGQPSGSDHAAIRDHMRNLGQFSTPIGRAMLAQAAQLLNRLALILPRLAQSSGTKIAAVDHPQTSRLLVDRFLRMASRDLGRGITIADFAQELNVTTRQLQHACQFHRGRSPLQLIYDLRLERAVALLRAGHPPAKIACQLGYVGLSHMKRVFIAATGRKPEDFANETAQVSS